jgi:hypothetical protein
MRNTILLALLLAVSGLAFAQVKLDYQQPPKEIMDLVDVPLAPSVLMDEDKEFMLLLYRDAYKTIAELSQTEMRLGGLRIDPKTNIGSRTTYFKDIKVKPVSGGTARSVQGLPENARLSNATWSPDQSMVAVTNTTEEGVEVWVLDVANANVRRITGPTVNANLRDVINWVQGRKCHPRQNATR